jgi:hypothetical protein
MLAPCPSRAIYRLSRGVVLPRAHAHPFSDIDFSFRTIPLACERDSLFTCDVAAAPV